MAASEYIRGFEEETATTLEVVNMDYYVNTFLNNPDMLESFRRFTRISINYKKDQDNNSNLILYFNYYNYLNSPYKKIVDGKMYVDTIPNTYLKLNRDETGFLDVVLQFRRETSGDIQGIKNLTVLRYQITNISDDKPKFNIRRIYKI